MAQATALRAAALPPHSYKIPRMSDDFGTVNVSRAERAREIEAIRQRYARHREALQRLAADAPNEHLATEYRRVMGEIDAALLKVNDLEPGGDLGMRPIVNTAPVIDDDEPRSGSGSRVALIAVAALIALGAIGWLIWKASSDRAEPGAIVEQTTTTETTTTAAPATVVEETPLPAADSVLTATPPSHDYGTIRKGTRATRQFEIANSSDQPVSVQVARSACRCLFYEYAEVVPPKGKETITVTVDGARAKAGALNETVKVTGRKDPSLATSFDVTANIQ